MRNAHIEKEHNINTTESLVLLKITEGDRDTHYVAIITYHPDKSVSFRSAEKTQVSQGHSTTFSIRTMFNNSRVDKIVQKSQMTTLDDVIVTNLYDATKPVFDTRRMR